MPIIPICLLLLGTLPPQDKPAQEEKRPTLRAGRLADDFTLDGRLDKPAWEKAEAIDNLTMIEPTEGAKPSMQTIVKVMADSKTIVIGIWCKDPEPDKITSYTVQRDGDLGSEDHVRVVLDTFQDGRSGYVFAVNPKGARLDALVVNHGEGENKDWDGIWEAATARDDTGWSVEIRIPILTLSFKKGLHEWNFNVQRRIQRILEIDRWASPKRDYRLTQTSRAGILTDLPDFDLGIGLNVRPSVLGSWGRTEPDRQTRFNGDASLDIWQKLGPNLTAQLTVNTDFSETEADARRINLTRFPLFFPEKRTFFLEGADIFDFGLGLGEDLVPFHSRTIGLVNGQVVPLWLGGKLNGRVGDTNLGALAVQTGREADVAPSTRMGVARVKQNVFEESSVGMIATAGDPLGRAGSWMAGGDFTYQTSRFLDDKNLLVGVWGLTMDRSDLPSGSKSAAGAKIEYPNDVLDLYFAYKWIGENFDPSLGFVPRPGIQKVETGAEVTLHPGWSWLRKAIFEFRPRLYTDLQGSWESYRLFTAPINLEFESGDSLEFNVIWQGEWLPDDFEISNGVVLPTGRYGWHRYRLVVGAASKRPVSGEISWGFGDFYDGTLDQIEISLVLNPMPLFTLSFAAEIDRGRLKEGNFDEDLFSARVRVNISPDINLSSFIQFDTVSRSVGANTRFRWTLTPVSDLFLVFNYNWLEMDGGLNPRTYQTVIKFEYTFRF